MPLIEGLRIQNYRLLQDVTLGKLWNNSLAPLTPMVAVIGKNGSGKSTLFDAFGFLKDCLQSGVEEACDLGQRGGFNKLVSAGHHGEISFEIYYREEPNQRPITYELTIALSAKGRPSVRRERLRQRRKGQSRGRPFSFLWLENGAGLAWSGAEALASGDDALPEVEEPGSVSVRMTDPRRLGIATLGTLRDHPRIARFREFLESWYLSYFTPDAARSLPLAGPQKHLNIHGDNLGNVVEFMQREHPERFERILFRIADRIPGVRSIDTVRMENGRLLLRFNDSSFKDPFFAQQVSDGTLKLFAYLLLLEDPEPPPFMCIEEPENGLYHKLLETLAAEFRSHTSSRKGGTQIFVTTHQPYFVNALRPEEVWVIEKAQDGFSRVKRASDDPLVVNLVKEEVPLGSLWYSDYLDRR